MLACRYEHLAGLVATLFAAVQLILHVDSCGTLFCEQFGEAEHGAQAAMTCVSIGNDRTQVVDPWRRSALICRHMAPLVPVLPIVVQLRLEQTLDLVRHSRVGIISEIRTNFVIAGGEHGGACPTRHVNHILLSCHLRLLHGVDRTQRRDGRAICGILLQQRIQLVGHERGCRWLDWHAASLGHNVARRVRPMNPSEPRAREPLLDTRDGALEHVRLFLGRRGDNAQGLWGRHEGPHRCGGVVGQRRSSRFRLGMATVLLLLRRR